METYSSNLSNKLKNLFTKRGTCFEILAFVGHIEHWQWLMRLLCNTTKEYYEQREHEFMELMTLTVGRGWEVMKLVRIYFDPHAYLPSEFDLPGIFDTSRFNAFYERIIENKLILPKFRLLHLKLIGSRPSCKDFSKKLNFKHVLKFLDHIYHKNYTSDTYLIPFETFKVDASMFNYFEVKDTIENLLEMGDCKVIIFFKYDPTIKEIFNILTKISQKTEIVFINMVSGKIKGEMVKSSSIESKINHIKLEENLMYFLKLPGPSEYVESLDSLYKYIIKFLSLLMETALHLPLESVELELLDTTRRHLSYPQRFYDALKRLPKKLQEYIDEKGMEFSFKFTFLPKSPC
ncbi:unnamed protein product [Moneuplotes crassus]|uniref:Uncharacterized protein n=1 Tax=Euplotes crassus TaxID=5936 RepID=A0AAD1XLL4_EUPCR|nr:unnamed protein product [Moneuplotes crassus]